MKKDILTEILFLRKNTRNTRKKTCEIIRINKNNEKNGYGLDYEVGNRTIY